MSENVSPNPMRKLKQTKLIFNKKQELILDLNPKKNQKSIKPLMSTKRIKKDETPNDIEIVSLETPTDTEPRVDPRLEDITVDPNSDDIIVIDDNTDEELPLEIKLELIDDCSANNPTVKALKSVDLLKEECLSLGLVLSEELYDYCSDSETEESTSDSKSGNFEVESIYDSRVDSDRITYYLVKWKNWSEEYNTWEPLSNLKNCRKLVFEFNHIKTIKTMESNRMDIYHNYYKLKGIIEDVIERKVPFDVLTTVLLVFNNIKLKDFNYTKALINKMRIQLKERQLSLIDKISEIEKTEKRVDQMVLLYNQLIDDLNVKKRFDTFDKFFEFFVKRRQTEFQLNRWENEINKIILKQKEGQTVRVENLVDCEVPLPVFEYISNCKTMDPNIVINDEPPIFCQCDDCETQSSECCVATNQSPINYTKNGILKDSRNNRNPIFECNNKCKCTQDCINRVVQKGRKHKLAIFRTDDERGWGVRALEPITKGSYVMEYVGEIISVEEANKRGHIYDAEGRTYLFDLDFNLDEEAKYTVDATQCGNVSHFVNHSCDPNLDTSAVWVNNLDPFMPLLALFAVRNIRLNEELTFDYKINVHGVTDSDQSKDNLDSAIILDSDDDLTEKPLRVSCRCGARNCRQYLF